MSFTSHIGKGAAIGFGIGAILCPYFYDRSQKISMEKCEIAAFPYLGLSFLCGAGGGPAGALTGAAIYGTKRGYRLLRKAPAPIQTIFWGTMLAAGGKAGHEFRRKN